MHKTGSLFSAHLKYLFLQSWTNIAETWWYFDTCFFCVLCLFVNLCCTYSSGFQETDYGFSERDSNRDTEFPADWFCYPLWFSDNIAKPWQRLGLYGMPIKTYQIKIQRFLPGGQCIEEVELLNAEYFQSD